MPFKNEPPLYRVWRSMRDRCRNPNFRQFADYGGRGITICERWEVFQNFVDDMGERPPGYSLDRVDNDGPYSPDNCRWADRSTQQRNQRRAVYVDIEGKRYRAIELAEQIGVKVDTIVERASRGLPLEKVMSKEKLHNLSGLALGGKASGKTQQAKTHCPQGHEYTPKNTIWTKQGWRQCRLCVNAKVRSQAARRRARQRQED